MQQRPIGYHRDNDASPSSPPLTSSSRAGTTHTGVASRRSTISRPSSNGAEYGKLSPEISLVGVCFSATRGPGLAGDSGRCIHLGSALIGIVASRCCGRTASSSFAEDRALPSMVTGTRCSSCLPPRKSQRMAVSIVGSMHREVERQYRESERLTFTLAMVIGQCRS